MALWSVTRTTSPEAWHYKISTHPGIHHSQTAKTKFRNIQNWLSWCCFHFRRQCGCPIGGVNNKELTAWSSVLLEKMPVTLQPKNLHFLCVVWFTLLSLAQTIQHQMINQLKRRGRKWSWPNLRYYPGIFLEGLRKPWKTSVRIGSLWAEIWGQDLLNIKQECKPHDSNIRSHLSRKLFLKILNNVKGINLCHLPVLLSDKPPT
jgi:hypothetical protein